jgi:hypothetical protein
MKNNKLNENDLKFLNFLYNVGDIKKSSFYSYKSQGFRKTKLQTLFFDVLTTQKPSEQLDKIIEITNLFNKD